MRHTFINCSKKPVPVKGEKKKGEVHFPGEAVAGNTAQEEVGCQTGGDIPPDSEKTYGSPTGWIGGDGLIERQEEGILEKHKRGCQHTGAEEERVPKGT